MENYMFVKDNIIGFGIDESDRLKDYEINKYAAAKELPNNYQILGARLRPWLPTSTMLYFSGIDCLKYERPMLISCNTQKREVINRFGRTVYFYLMGLLGDKVTYEEIRVVLHKAIDTFFSNISGSFVPLSEYNSIFVCDKHNFDNAQITKYDGYSVAVTRDYVGLKLDSADAYYALNRQDDLDSDICYLAYRAGVIYDV